MTNASGVVEQKLSLCQMRISIQHVLISLLPANNRETAVPRLHDNFSSKGCSMQLIVFSLNRGVLGMIGWKEKLVMDMVFPIIGANIDTDLGLKNDANTTGVHHLYLDMMSKVVFQNSGWGWLVPELGNLRRDICACKHQVVTVFAGQHTRTIYAKLPALGPSDRR